MPGLSQLKQFTKDVLSLGDEVSLRSQRGEKPVIVPIPKAIQDINDSEDFVMGMPEIEAIVQDNSADDDLSDLMGITGGGDTEQKKKEEEPVFQAPDLSSLLAPMQPADDSGGMPDLSDFLEPEEEEPVEEKEPEPISVADMSLEDLLGGDGFDGSSVEEFAQDTTTTADEEEFYTGGFGDENYVPTKREPPKAAAFNQILDDMGLDKVDEIEDAPASQGDALSLDELGIEEAEPLDEIETLEEEPLDFDIPDIAESAQSDDNLSLDEMPSLDDATPLDDTTSLDEMPSLDEPLEAALETPSEEPLDFDIPDIAESVQSDDNLSLDDMPSLDDATSLDDMPSLDDATSLDEMPSLDDAAPLEAALETPSEEPLDFDIPDIAESAQSDDNLSLDDMPSLDDAAPLDEMPSLDDATSLDEPLAAETEDASLTAGFESDFGDAAAGLDSIDFNMDDMPSIDSSPVPDASAETEIAGIDGLDVSDISTPEGLFDSSDMENPGETPDISENVPDFGMDDFEMPSGGEPPKSSDDISVDDFMGESNPDGDVPIEDFDTSEMEGISFDIPETDTQLNTPEASGFEFGQDFTIDGQEFEIPGFSDVETAKEEKRSTTLLSSSDGNKGKNREEDEEEDLQPNTLSDSQYKQFLKNLSEYPLNVRLAFEELIVKNEFTDEAEFEIVEKILNKSSARSVASMLEKMLDISIPVPRDYEHRTAEEYEAYKKSLQYQLKNKIIPLIFAAMLCIVVGWGLFQFGKNCIYIPAKANSLYKQGYAMLEADEYPQSEINFNDARKLRQNRKWYFKYARGYREHKQYLRAEWMYQNILNDFKHDKEAGLEYAEMELNDLANYERAEEICRREILDYHINDKDGILLLGDIFLEWGTEKEPEMLEKAREQYATLIQLYKSNMLYESRMMRYFIRTDNLRNVLQQKQKFISKEKNLSAEDWTELSGYLMDKLYGPLAPSDEYLRTSIEDVHLMLMRAVKLDPANPNATYNLSRYFIETNEPNAAKDSLAKTIDNFKNSSYLKKREIYKYIDSYRLLGEQYSDAQEYLRAQEYYTDGISLYTAERDASGFEGNQKIGVLYADQANIDYFISGDFDSALRNYISSVNLQNDTPSIRYRIGYIQYQKKNYAEALGSFMKAGDGNIKETNLMLAMGNTLSLRGDDYAAQGYYDDLIKNLDRQIADKGIVLPQMSKEDYNIVETYLHAANNYGVTLYRLASRTGNSTFNAEAIVQLSQSVRAWDALTRNQETLVRLSGSNLAEENIKYVTHPIPEFEPAIYTEIPRILVNSERF